MQYTIHIVDTTQQWVVSQVLLVSISLVVLWNTSWMTMVMETSEHTHLVGGTTRSYLNTPVGTINYATGLILIDGLNITGSTETAGITITIHHLQMMLYQFATNY